MRKVWRTQVVVANLLLALSATGCNGQHQQAKLAQSEEALRGLKDGGVITEQEYNQRLAQLQSTGQAAAEKTSYTSNHTWRMKKVQLKAMTGWPAMPEWNIAAKPEQQIVAFSMLVPVDWQFTGGVNEHKKPDCNFTIGRIGFAALSPDKTAGMVSIPHSVSIWSNDASVLQQVQQDNQKFAKIYNCKIEQPHPLQQQMSSLVQEFSSDSNGKIHAVGAMESVPGDASKLQSAVDRINQQLAQQGAQLTVETGRIPIRNDDPKDTGEGYFTVMRQIRTDRLPNGATLSTIDIPLRVVTFAPHGKYASMESMFAAMLDSVHLDPDYQQNTMQVSMNLQSIQQQTKQKLNQIASQMQLDNMNAARQQAAIRQGARNYASHVMSSVAANRSAAMEHSAQQFSLHMGDQAQYRDPQSGGIVQLPSVSSHVWSSQTGNNNEYLLTDSPSFNPNGQVGSSGWTEMKEVH